MPSSPSTRAPLADGGGALAKLPRWEDVSPDLRRSFDDRIAKLDVLPLGTVRLVSALCDPDADPREIARMAAVDPSIAAELFRLVNSAFFGLREPVRTIQRALLFLGYTRVKFVVLRLGLGRAAGDSLPRRRLTEVWRHCFLAGEALQALEPWLPGIDIKEVQTAALLHDLGKALLAESPVRDGLADELECESEALPMEERILLETDCFGLNHCLLGVRISERLQLPPLVSAVQEHHHLPVECLPENGRPQIAAVKLASILAHHFAYRDDEERGGPIFPTPDLAPYRRLFPSLPDYADLVERVEPVLLEASSFLAAG